MEASRCGVFEPRSMDDLWNPNNAATYEAFVFFFGPGSNMQAANKSLATARLARQTAVDWNGAIERPDHFYLPWKVPASFRAAWAWGSRVFTAVSIAELWTYTR